MSLRDHLPAPARSILHLLRKSDLTPHIESPAQAVGTGKGTGELYAMTATGQKRHFADPVHMLSFMQNAGHVNMAATHAGVVGAGPVASKDGIPGNHNPVYTLQHPTLGKQFVTARTSTPESPATSAGGTTPPQQGNAAPAPSSGQNAPASPGTAESAPRPIGGTYRRSMRALSNKLLSGRSAPSPAPAVQGPPHPDSDTMAAHQLQEGWQRLAPHLLENPRPDDPRAPHREITAPPVGPVQTNPVMMHGSPTSRNADRPLKPGRLKESDRLDGVLDEREFAAATQHASDHHTFHSGQDALAHLERAGVLRRYDPRYKVAQSAKTDERTGAPAVAQPKEVRTHQDLLDELVRQGHLTTSDKPESPHPDHRVPTRTGPRVFYSVQQSADGTRGTPTYYHPTPTHRAASATYQDNGSAPEQDLSGAHAILRHLHDEGHLLSRPSRGARTAQGRLQAQQEAAGIRAASQSKAAGLRFGEVNSKRDPRAASVRARLQFEEANKRAREEAGLAGTVGSYAPQNVDLTGKDAGFARVNAGARGFHVVARHTRTEPLPAGGERARPEVRLHNPETGQTSPWTSTDHVVLSGEHDPDTGAELAHMVQGTPGRANRTVSPSRLARVRQRVLSRFLGQGNDRAAWEKEEDRREKDAKKKGNTYTRRPFQFGGNPMPAGQEGVVPSAAQAPDRSKREARPTTRIRRLPIGQATTAGARTPGGTEPPVSYDQVWSHLPKDAQNRELDDPRLQEQQVGQEDENEGGNDATKQKYRHGDSPWQMKERGYGSYAAASAPNGYLVGEVLPGGETRSTVHDERSAAHAHAQAIHSAALQARTRGEQPESILDPRHHREETDTQGQGTGRFTLRPVTFSRSGREPYTKGSVKRPLKADEMAWYTARERELKAPGHPSGAGQRFRVASMDHQGKVSITGHRTFGDAQREALGRQLQHLQPYIGDVVRGHAYPLKRPPTPLAIPQRGDHPKYGPDKGERIAGQYKTPADLKEELGYEGGKPLRTPLSPDQKELLLGRARVPGAPVKAGRGSAQGTAPDTYLPAGDPARHHYHAVAYNMPEETISAGRDKHVMQSFQTPEEARAALDEHHAQGRRVAVWDTSSATPSEHTALHRAPGVSWDESTTRPLTHLDRREAQWSEDRQRLPYRVLSKRPDGSTDLTAHASLREARAHAAEQVRALRQNREGLDRVGRTEIHDLVHGVALHPHARQSEQPDNAGDVDYTVHPDKEGRATRRWNAWTIPAQRSLSEGSATSPGLDPSHPRYVDPHGPELFRVPHHAIHTGTHALRQKEAEAQLQSARTDEERAAAQTALERIKAEPYNDAKHMRDADELARTYGERWLPADEWRNWMAHYLEHHPNPNARLSASGAAQEAGNLLREQEEEKKKWLEDPKASKTVWQGGERVKVTGGGRRGYNARPRYASLDEHDQPVPYAYDSDGKIISGSYDAERAPRLPGDVFEQQGSDKLFPELATSKEAQRARRAQLRAQGAGQPALPAPRTPEESLLAEVPGWSPEEVHAKLKDAPPELVARVLDHPAFTNTHLSALAHAAAEHVAAHPDAGTLPEGVAKRAEDAEVAHTTAHKAFSDLLRETRKNPLFATHDRLEEIPRRVKGEDDHQFDDEGFPKQPTKWTRAWKHAAYTKANQEQIDTIERALTAAEQARRTHIGAQKALQAARLMAGQPPLQYDRKRTGADWHQATEQASWRAGIEAARARQFAYGLQNGGQGVLPHVADQLGVLPEQVQAHFRGAPVGQPALDNAPSSDERESLPSLTPPAPGALVPAPEKSRLAYGPEHEPTSAERAQGMPGGAYGRLEKWYQQAMADPTQELRTLYGEAYTLPRGKTEDETKEKHAALIHAIYRDELGHLKRQESTLGTPRGVGNLLLAGKNRRAESSDALASQVMAAAPADPEGQRQIQGRFHRRDVRAAPGLASVGAKSGAARDLHHVYDDADELEAALEGPVGSAPETTTGATREDQENDDTITGGATQDERKSRVPVLADVRGARVEPPLANDAVRYRNPEAIKVSLGEARDRAAEAIRAYYQAAHPLRGLSGDEHFSDTAQAAAARAGQLQRPAQEAWDLMNREQEQLRAHDREAAEAHQEDNYAFLSRHGHALHAADTALFGHQAAHTDRAAQEAYQAALTEARGSGIDPASVPEPTHYANLEQVTAEGSKRGGARATWPPVPGLTTGTHTLLADAYTARHGAHLRAMTAAHELENHHLFSRFAPLKQDTVVPDEETRRRLATEAEREFEPTPTGDLHRLGQQATRAIAAYHGHIARGLENPEVETDLGKEAHQTADERARLRLEDAHALGKQAQDSYDQFQQGYAGHVRAHGDDPYLKDTLERAVLGLHEGHARVAASAARAAERAAEAHETASVRDYKERLKNKANRPSADDKAYASELRDRATGGDLDAYSSESGGHKPLNGSEKAWLDHYQDTYGRPLRPRQNYADVAHNLDVWDRQKRFRAAQWAARQGEEAFNKLSPEDQALHAQHTAAGTTPLAELRRVRWGHSRDKHAEAALPALPHIPGGDVARFFDEKESAPSKDEEPVDGQDARDPRRDAFMGSLDEALARDTGHLKADLPSLRERIRDAALGDEGDEFRERTPEHYPDGHPYRALLETGQHLEQADHQADLVREGIRASHDFDPAQLTSKQQNEQDPVWQAQKYWEPGSPVPTGSKSEADKWRRKHFHFSPHRPVAERDTVGGLFPERPPLLPEDAWDTRKHEEYTKGPFDAVGATRPNHGDVDYLARHPGLSAPHDTEGTPVGTHGHILAADAPQPEYAKNYNNYAIDAMMRDPEAARKGIWVGGPARNKDGVLGPYDPQNIWHGPFERGTGYEADPHNRGRLRQTTAARQGIAEAYQQWLATNKGALARVNELKGRKLVSSGPQAEVLADYLNLLHGHGTPEDSRYWNAEAFPHQDHLRHMLDYSRQFGPKDHEQETAALQARIAANAQPDARAMNDPARLAETYEETGQPFPRLAHADNPDFPRVPNVPRGPRATTSGPSILDHTPSASREGEEQSAQETGTPTSAHTPTPGTGGVRATAVAEAYRAARERALAEARSGPVHDDAYRAARDAAPLPAGMDQHFLPGRGAAPEDQDFSPPILHSGINGVNRIRRPAGLPPYAITDENKQPTLKPYEAGLSFGKLHVDPALHASKGPILQGQLTNPFVQAALDMHLHEPEISGLSREEATRAYARHLLHNRALHKELGRLEDTHLGQMPGGPVDVARPTTELVNIAREQDPATRAALIERSHWFNKDELADQDTLHQAISAIRANSPNWQVAGAESQERQRAANAAAQPARTPSVRDRLDAGRVDRGDPAFMGRAVTPATPAETAKEAAALRSRRPGEREYHGGDPHDEAFLRAHPGHFPYTRAQVNGKWQDIGPAPIRTSTGGRGAQIEKYNPAYHGPADQVQRRNASAVYVGAGSPFAAQHPLGNTAQALPGERFVSNTEARTRAGRLYREEQLFRDPTLRAHVARLLTGGKTLVGSELRGGEGHVLGEFANLLSEPDPEKRRALAEASHFFNSQEVHPDDLARYVEHGQQFLPANRTPDLSAPALSPEEAIQQRAAWAAGQAATATNAPPASSPSGAAGRDDLTGPAGAREDELEAQALATIARENQEAHAHARTLLDGNFDGLSLPPPGTRSPADARGLMPIYHAVQRVLSTTSPELYDPATRAAFADAHAGALAGARGQHESTDELQAHHTALRDAYGDLVSAIPGFHNKVLDALSAPPEPQAQASRPITLPASRETGAPEEAAGGVRGALAQQQQAQSTPLPANPDDLSSEDLYDTGEGGAGAYDEGGTFAGNEQPDLWAGFTPDTSALDTSSGQPPDDEPPPSSPSPATPSPAPGGGSGGGSGAAVATRPAATGIQQAIATSAPTTQPQATGIRQAMAAPTPSPVTTPDPSSLEEAKRLMGKGGPLQSRGPDKGQVHPHAREALVRALADHFAATQGGAYPTPEAARAKAESHLSSFVNPKTGTLEYYKLRPTVQGLHERALAHLDTMGQATPPSPSPEPPEDEEPPPTSPAGGGMPPTAPPSTPAGGDDEDEETPPWWNEGDQQAGRKGIRDALAQAADNLPPTLHNGDEDEAYRRYERTEDEPPF